MDNRTAYAITEVLGEALARRQDGIDNCLEHIEQLNAVNERLIAENKKMKEELDALKSDCDKPVKVADYGRFGIAEGVDATEYENTRPEDCGGLNCCGVDG